MDLALQFAFLCSARSIIGTTSLHYSSLTQHWSREGPKESSNLSQGIPLERTAPVCEFKPCSPPYYQCDHGKSTSACLSLLAYKMGVEGSISHRIMVRNIQRAYSNAWHIVSTQSALTIMIVVLKKKLRPREVK